MGIQNHQGGKRKKDAALSAHHLLTYAEQRNSRRQTLKNMRTGNNEGRVSAKRNRTENKVQSSVKRIGRRQSAK